VAGLPISELQRRAIGTSRGDRWIKFAEHLAPLPERLLLAHAQGRVLLIAGAGVSRPSGYPDFRKLVVDIYQAVDRTVFEVLQGLPNPSPGLADNKSEQFTARLNANQAAEVDRFLSGDFDVTLGMLERRVDTSEHAASRVRAALRELLRGKQPAEIHHALVRLAHRGGATSLATTNFDLLFEEVGRRRRLKLPSSALGAIPRPSQRPEFSGIFHIHGMLDRDPSRATDILLTDRDFGEFYLRRRIIPDFIYDVARLFHVVLVGYSLNDAPMRYLLNAVAADGVRFGDLKERFALVGAPFPFDRRIEEDWKGRGITPIVYDDRDGHRGLSDVLTAWADMSPFAGKSGEPVATLRRLVAVRRESASASTRGLFDYLMRRSSRTERARWSSVISRAGAGPAWLDALIEIDRERPEERVYVGG
jgi:SIR2-like protein